VRLQPILPVVFYTGTYRWEKLGTLADLIEMGEAFADVTPAFRPRFVNLPEVPAGELESAGGYFGRVLRLVQQRRTRRGEFQALLRQAVGHLEGMPAEERLRWLELLSYLHALVYHERAGSERKPLLDAIAASVGTDEHRQRVTDMRQTIADVLRNEGVVVGKRETLISQLRQRFETLPDETVRLIESTGDVQQLDLWLSRVLTAKTLAGVGIRPKA
jgi:hypothetical protein